MRLRGDEFYPLFLKDALLTVIVMRVYFKVLFRVTKLTKLRCISSVMGKFANFDHVWGPGNHANWIKMPRHPLPLRGCKYFFIIVAFIMYKV